MNKRAVALCIVLIAFVFHFNAQTILSSQIINADGIDYQKTLQRTSFVTHPAEGVTFFDFQRDAFCQVRLHVDNPTNGDTIYVYTGECVKDGRVNRNPGGTKRCREMMAVTKANQTDYDLQVPKDERNTGRNAVKMPPEVGDVTPFRYVEVVGTPSSEALRIMVNVPFDDDAAYFHCDNDTLNQVWELCKHTIKATSFTGHYVDGDRERIPYEADALINQLGHYSVDASYDMARRTFEHLISNPTWPTEWILQMPMIAWNDYLYTGNTQLIKKYAKELQAHTLMTLHLPDATEEKEWGDTLLITTRRGQSEEFLKSINRNEKIDDIVDWPHCKGFDSENGEDDHYVYTDFNTVVNAYHYEAVKCLERMALSPLRYENRQTGAREERSLFREIGKVGQETGTYLKKFHDNFNELLLDKERGYYRDGVGTDHASLHANMFALLFGLVPEEYKKSVSEFIVSRTMDSAGSPNIACSVYGSQFLLDALYDSGQADVALRLMTNNSHRSWVNMLREGSTMTMEAWGDEFKSNQDWNHAWGAAPANIIPRRLVGVRPLKPGFEEVEIRPQIATLKKIESKVPTPKGPIYVNINKASDKPTITITAPKNMKVTLVLPDNTKKKFKANGKERSFKGIEF